MAGAIISGMGDLLTVEIDPAWPHIELWRHPKGTILSAQFMDFESGISEMRQSNYADAEVMGRPENFKTYLNTSNREVQLVFRFRAQGTSSQVDERIGGDDLNSAFDSDFAAVSLDANGVQARDGFGQFANSVILDNEVLLPMKFLDALQEGVEGPGGLAYAPPPVILTIGQLLKMRCYVTACQVDWQAALDPDTMKFHGVDVPVTFTSVAPRIGNYDFLSPWRMGRSTADVDSTVLTDRGLIAGDPRGIGQIGVPG